ncbi:hypothetical protein SASPL_113604 [Salvia splendens]|uniref:Uncharacterized protein n=1 Tax=Salvia splendens TaxID=180675 RepID=A0A8X8Y3Z3_SALSN|nr:hypothetical protein SASPL_113604 [Salvia splendens]
MIAILPQGLLALCMLSFLNSKRMLVMEDGQGAIGGEVTIRGFAALLVGFFNCSHHWSFCCLSPSRVSGAVIIKLCPGPSGLETTESCCGNVAVLVEEDKQAQNVGPNAGFVDDQEWRMSEVKVNISFWNSMVMGFSSYPHGSEECRKRRNSIQMALVLAWLMKGGDSSTVASFNTMHVVARAGYLDEAWMPIEPDESVPFVQNVSTYRDGEL